MPRPWSRLVRIFQGRFPFLVGVPTESGKYMDTASYTIGSGSQVDNNYLFIFRIITIITDE